MALTPINEIVPYKQYTASVGATEFSGNWWIGVDGDVSVFVDGVIQLTGYTVDGLQEPSGFTITFSTPMLGGEIVTLAGDFDIERLTGYLSGGNFRADSLNLELSTHIAIMLQLQRNIDRKVGFSITDTIVTDDIGFPAPQDDTVIAWDGVTGKMKNGPTVASIEAAAAQASAADAAATAAAASAAAASSSATASAGSATQAGIYRDQAQAAAATAARPGFYFAGTYGVVSSTSANSTTAMSTAFTAMTFGGTLSLESLQPRFDGALTVPNNVTVFGGNKMPIRESSNSTGSAPSGNTGSIGTSTSKPNPLIQCRYNYNDPTRAQFTLSTRSGMEGLYFAEPLQVNTGSTLVDCGPALSLTGTATTYLKNLMFNNSYRWIEIGAAGGGGGGIMDSIYGTPLGVCLSILKTADVQKINNFHGQTYWTKGASGSALETLMETTSVFMRFGDVDGIQVSNSSCFKCGTFMHLVDNGTGQPWLIANNLLADKVVYAVDAEAVDLVQINNLIATGRDPSPKLAWEPMIRLRSTIGDRAMFLLDGFIAYNAMNGILVEADKGSYSLKGLKRKLKLDATTVAGRYQPDALTGLLLISTNEANIVAEIDDPWPFNCFMGSALTLNGVRFPKKGGDITPANFSKRSSFGVNANALDLVELPYTGQTANFTVGQVVTGGTSGATGTLVEDTDSGTTGTLRLRDTTGTFSNAETITDPLGGSATTATANMKLGISLDMRAATIQSITQNLTAEVIQDGLCYLQVRCKRRAIGTSTDSNAQFVIVINDTTNGRSFEHMQNVNYQNWTTETTFIMPLMLNPRFSHNIELRWGQQDDGVDTMELMDFKVFRMPRVEVDYDNSNTATRGFGLDLNKTVQAICGSTFYKDPSNLGAPMSFEGTRRTAIMAATPTAGSWWPGDRIIYPAPTSGGFVGEVCTAGGTFGTLNGGSTTGTISSGFRTMTVNDATGLREGDLVTCSTAYPSTAPGRVVKISGTTITMAAPAAATATTQAVAYGSPVFKTFGAIS